MNLADKLVAQRKKKGISQEELADMLDVSRQSVSKWESTQCAPELNKLVQISEIYGVSLDYLLKDGEEEKKEVCTSVEKERESVGKLDDAEVRDFLRKSAAGAVFGTASTLFFILAPILCGYFLFAGFQERSLDMRLSVILCASLTAVCLAVATVLLIAGMRCVKKYGYMQEKEFCLQDNTQDHVRLVCERTAKIKVVAKVAGALFVLAAAGLTVGALFVREAASGLILSALISADCAVSCFIAGVLLVRPFKVLDARGKYGKKSDRVAKAAVAVIYWLAVVAVFCANYLVFNNTDIAIAVLVAGTIVFLAVLFAVRYVNANKKQ